MRAIVYKPHSKTNETHAVIKHIS